MAEAHLPAFGEVPQAPGGRPRRDRSERLAATGQTPAGARSGVRNPAADDTRRADDETASRRGQSRPQGEATGFANNVPAFLRRPVKAAP